MRVVKQMGPAILGVSVSQISLIINTIFASFLVSGSVSWMYYADRLMEFPSGVLGVALGTILLPSLSKSFASGNHDEYCRLMDWGLRLCFLLALPSAVALGILAKPLTVALFQYGKFSAFDAAMTQRALVAYSVGLMGLIVVKVLAPGFYSRQDIKTPVKIAIITLIMTQVMNLAFIGPLKHAGLSLSIGLAACLNAALLYWQLRKQKIFTPQPGWLAFLLRLIIAVLVMAAALLGVMHLMPEWSLGTMPFRLMRLLAVVIAGVVAYFATLLVLGFRVKEFVRRTRGRHAAVRPIVAAAVEQIVLVADHLVVGDIHCGEAGLQRPRAFDPERVLAVGVPVPMEKNIREIGFRLPCGGVDGAFTDRRRRRKSCANIFLMYEFTCATE